MYGANVVSQQAHLTELITIVLQYDVKNLRHKEQLHSVDIRRGWRLTLHVMHVKLIIATSPVFSTLCEPI